MAARIKNLLAVALPLLLPIMLLAALVLWLRLLPGQLAVAEMWAEQNLQGQLASQLDPRLSPAQQAVALENLRRNNRQVVDEAQAELAEAFRRDHSFMGGDGRRHLFLGGDDSYYFLRQARDILHHGSPCAAWRDGQCMDALANAPLGRAVERPYSIHPYAIAGLHRLLLLAMPGLPIMVAANMLPTLLSLLAVPAVFLALYGLLDVKSRIGRSLAALLGTGVALMNLPLIGRSLGGDNDIWVALLPLLAALLLALGLQSGVRWRVAMASALAGLLLGLLASNWGGWHLFAAVFLVSNAGLVAQGLLAHGFRRSGLALPGRAALSLLVLTISMLLVAMLLAGGLDVMQGLRDVAGALSFNRPPSLASPIPEANAFATVAELQKIPLADMGRYFGWPVFVAGLIGPLLALLPPLWPRAVQFAAAAVAALLLLAVAWVWPEHGFQLLALGLAGLAGLLVLLKTRAGSNVAALPLISAVWLFAALMLSHEGQRYLLLLGPPLGLGVALAVAFLLRALWPLAVTRLPSWARMPAAAAGGLALLLIAGLSTLPISAREAAMQQPRLNQAWAEVLGHVRQHSRSDSILVGWWDYGHFITFMAERPTVIDGASLRYSTVHWVGRILTAAEPAEARGLLRMLACGGNAQGIRPYEALLQAGLNRAQALTLIGAIVRVERVEAQLLLEAAGVAPLLRDILLRYTHCQAPPQILITSDALLDTPAWALSGFWNPDLAWLVEAVRRGSDLASTAERLGLPAQGMADIVAQARAASGSDFARSLFAAPGADIWSSAWHGCQAGNQGQMHCPLDLRGADGVLLHSLSFDPAAPGDLWLDATHPQGMRIKIKPQLIRVALPDRLLDLTVADGANLAVIVEPQTGRVFITSPGIARSLLVRLTLLAGRYDTAWLENIAAAQSVQGETVAAWRVR